MGLVISGLRGSGFRALRLSIQDFQSLGIVFPDFRCGMKGFWCCKTWDYNSWGMRLWCQIAPRFFPGVMRWNLLPIENLRIKSLSLTRTTVLVAGFSFLNPKP